MRLFFRIFQHLLPDSIAWRIKWRNVGWTWGDGHTWGEIGLLWGWVATGRMIDRLFTGLAAVFTSARSFIDLAWLDLLPDSTRELEAWEKQFGLIQAPTTEDRRAAVAAAWLARGGQSPRYLQDVVQAAGFPLYLHDWWTEDRTAARNPLLYTQAPLIGTTQCGETLAQCGEPLAICNGFLANEPGYIVNDNLTPTAPPPIIIGFITWGWVGADDPELVFPFGACFLYWGGETFGDRVEIPEARRRELERLLLGLCPANCWIVTLIDYV